MLHSPTNVSLRKQMRQRRRRLSQQQQLRRSQQLARHCQHVAAFQAARKVGLYIAADGEADPAQIAHLLWRLGKTCYLPAVGDDNGDVCLVERTPLLTEPT